MLDGRAQAHEPSRGRVEPVPTAARAQPRGLVPLGRRGARALARRGQADTPEHRLFGLPLVPRHGARVVRERRDRAADERAVRQHQSRPRGAPRPRPDLHERRADDDATRRLAAHGLPHARPRPLLRRHLLPARRPAPDARLPPRTRVRLRGVPRAPRRGSPVRLGDTLRASAHERRAGVVREHRRAATRPRLPRPRALLRPAPRRLRQRAEVPFLDERRIPPAHIQAHGRRARS